MSNEIGEVVLSPAYDLLSTKLMPIEDKEEMALTINGKKAKIKKEDFEVMGKTLGISEKAIENSFVRMATSISDMKTIINNSFLSNDLKKRYEELLKRRAKILAQ